MRLGVVRQEVLNINIVEPGSPQHQHLTLQRSSGGSTNYEEHLNLNRKIISNNDLAPLARKTFQSTGLIEKIVVDQVVENTVGLGSDNIFVSPRQF